MKGKRTYYGEWDEKLETAVKKFGGWVNAHTHLDRANGHMTNESEQLDLKNFM